MGLAENEELKRSDRPMALQVYLLGTVDFEALLRCQRRLQYEIAGERDRAALILCEHPPMISIGRHGSRAHILLEQRELELRGWPLRWVNRGGGCWLHQPGQLAAYVLLPLDRLGLSVAAYQNRLGQLVTGWLADLGVRCQWYDHGAWVENRLLAGLGCAVRNWVSYFGLCLNINPVLDHYRLVRCAPGTQLPMTSLERERHRHIRPSLARERFIEHFQAAFAFERLSLFTEYLPLNELSQRSAPPHLAYRE